MAEAFWLSDQLNLTCLVTLVRSGRLTPTKKNVGLTDPASARASASHHFELRTHRHEHYRPFGVGIVEGSNRARNLVATVLAALLRSGAQLAICCLHDDARAHIL